MRDHIWYSRFFAINAALLLVASFETSPRTQSAANSQAAELSEIRWEFDTGG